jgi:hypothetical protein
LLVSQVMFTRTERGPDGHRNLPGKDAGLGPIQHVHDVPGI